MLNIINFTHGAQYMMGAFAAYLLLQHLGINYWEALMIAPILIGVTGIVIERLFLKHIRKLDPLYSLLLTFGLGLVIEGLFRNYYGSSGLPYQVPDALRGGRNLGFMFLPNYRAWVIILSVIVCFATWFGIERTRLWLVPACRHGKSRAGARLRHQRAANGDAHLWLWCRARGAGGRHGGADL